MFTIDAHAHVFPAKIAHNAVKSISNFYQQPMCGDGTAEDLIRRGARRFRTGGAMGFDTVGEPGMDAPENCAFSARKSLKSRFGASWSITKTNGSPNR